MTGPGGWGLWRVETRTTGDDTSASHSPRELNLNLPERSTDVNVLSAEPQSTLDPILDEHKWHECPLDEWDHQVIDEKLLSSEELKPRTLVGEAHKAFCHLD
ncbi:hypothetical protein BY996DRAFT_8402657 [Phakopsora pachyrhizi]|nr:hypothetical protein BY996DRAFT_8402657 [Phakopsora pachyrhizi]